MEYEPVTLDQIEWLSHNMEADNMEVENSMTKLFLNRFAEYKIQGQSDKSEEQKILNWTRSNAYKFLEFIRKKEEERLSQGKEGEEMDS
jgi:hypothetical protein